jgi:SAM-dependent methyltransferase
MVESKAQSQRFVKSVIKLLIPRALENLIARWRANRVHQRYAGLTLSDAFDRIYESQAWARGNSSMTSGWGSTGRYAEEYCALLKDLLATHGIKSVADLGCGNFNTGRMISAMVAGYTGVDITQKIVDANTRAYGGEHVRFVRADITRDVLPPADAAIVRQVFQHLSNSEIQAALDNVLRTYCLAFITEHIYVGRGAKPNLDISHGPGTRVQIKSGVLIDHPPFNVSAALVGDIARASGEVLRTWAVTGAGG